MSANNLSSVTVCVRGGAQVTLHGSEAEAVLEILRGFCSDEELESDSSFEFTDKPKGDQWTK